MTNFSSRIIDEALVLEAQAGSPRALNLLIERWQGPLLSYAKRFFRREDVAWDVSQEAWMGIAKGLSGLDDPAAFPAWAYRIVTNKCKDRLRQEGRHRELKERLAEDNGQNRIDNDDSMELREIFETLSGEMQAVLTLRYYEGFSVAEIGEILDLAAGTVKSRLHRARAELKKRLET